MKGADYLCTSNKNLFKILNIYTFMNMKIYEQTLTIMTIMTANTNEKQLQCFQLKEWIF